MSYRTAPSNFLNRLRSIRAFGSDGTTADNTSSDASESASASSSPAPEPHAGRYNENGHHDPSPIDVAVVRIMLVKATKLPVDVVDGLLDHAEYWVRSSTVADYSGNVQKVSRFGIQDKFVLRSLPIGFTSEHGGNLDRTGRPAPPRPLKSEVSSKALARMADYPLPRLQSPVRKIVFKISSHDQGWSQGAELNLYHGSWTWFEAGLERFEGEEFGEPQDPPPTPLDAQKLRPVYPLIAEEKTDTENQPVGSAVEQQDQAAGASKPQYAFDLLPSDQWTICKNKRAHGDFQDHVITWTCYDNTRSDSAQGKALEEAGRGRETGNGEFVRSLKIGDVVTLWAKARFPGWVNNVKLASMDVYWAAA